MARRKKLTPEEERIARLEREYKDKLRDLEHCPEPTYFFKVGDPVQIGALKHSIIAEVCEDGKFYKVEYDAVSRDRELVNADENGKSYSYWEWHALRPVSTATESLIRDEDLRLHFQNSQIGSILSMRYHFGLDLDPEYQRGYEWTTEDKVALIDSIFHNRDIGKFCFVHNNYGDDYLYEVLDGKQRVKTILDFYENRFPYKGYYFNDLCVKDRNHFENYHIATAQIENGGKEYILKYFLSLNKCGRTVSEEHLEKVEKMLDETRGH